MLSTYLRPEAVKRLRHGIPWAFRDEILSMDGTPEAGEPVQLRDERGEPLGLGDVDLEAALAIRRLGLPNESAQGLIQRHLRIAVRRRALWLEEVRFGRLINDEGDGLPGLIIDRYDTHYVVQPITRAMDARVDEIARSLREVMGASSVLLRTDTHVRERLQLPVGKPHVLLGAPPRWSRVLELGARMTFDLFMGPGTGYPYDERELRRMLARISYGARVLEANCRVGGLFVHAGIHGAKQIVAGTENPDWAELARENVEANALMATTHVDTVSPREMLDSVNAKFDLVLVRIPYSPKQENGDGSAEFMDLARLAVRATRHGGRLVLAASSETVAPAKFEDQVALACEAEGRLGYGLAKPGMPGDFPVALGSPSAVSLNTLAMEVS